MDENLNKRLGNAVKNVNGYSGDIAQVENLLNLQANPNTILENGMTPLIRASTSTGDNSEIIQMLIQHNADVNQKALGNNSGQTALIFAAKNNNPENVRELLSHGANPNEKDDGGLTPLMKAVIHSRDENGAKIIQLLIDNGANPNEMLDDNGQTPLMMASRRENSGKNIETLVDNGAADINNVNTEEYDPDEFEAEDSDAHPSNREVINRLKLYKAREPLLKLVNGTEVPESHYLNSPYTPHAVSAFVGTDSENPVGGKKSNKRHRKSNKRHRKSNKRHRKSNKRHRKSNKRHRKSNKSYLN
jgi:ankyrin repeat protein